MYNVYYYPLSDKVFKHISTVGGGAYEDRKEHVSADCRLDNSFSRTRRLFSDYGLCNEFDLFVTITFDQKQYNSMDYDAVRSVLCKWFNNYRNRECKDFQYMLIPERHKSGAWHFHGLVTVPYGLCTPLEIPKRVGKNVLQVPNTRHYLSWPAFSKKFGHFSASFIRDYAKAVRYITKYISKDFVGDDLRGRQLLLKSKGLRKPELIHSTYEDVLLLDGERYEFCTVAWSDEFGRYSFVKASYPLATVCPDVDELREYTQQLCFV